MTMIARGWLALELTDSSFMVTAVNAVGMLPMLVLSAFGGVIADRMNRRLVLIASDVFNFVVVLALAVLIVADMVNIQLVFALTILHGVGFALGMPARAATVSNLVDQKDLASGVALFTTIFSAGMLVGPALAGYLINSFGMGTCFVAASIVLVPALVFLFLLRLPSVAPGFGAPARTSVLGSIVQGMDYVRRSKVLVGLMLMGTAATVFAMPYQTLLPVFARDILHAGPGGLGWLGAMGGAGAIAGSITVASFSNPKQLRALMITGGLGLGLFIALFAYSTLYLLSLALVLVVGYLFQIFMTSNFTLVQIISPDYVRGRVLSIRMIAAGMAPVGMLMLGVGAETWGAPVATASMGILSLVLVCAILVGIPSVRRVETTMGEEAPTAGRGNPGSRDLLLVVEVHGPLQAVSQYVHYGVAGGGQRLRNQRSLLGGECAKDVLDVVRVLRRPPYANPDPGDVPASQCGNDGLNAPVSSCAPRWPDAYPAQGQVHVVVYDEQVAEGYGEAGGEIRQGLSAVVHKGAWLGQRHLFSLNRALAYDDCRASVGEAYP